MSTNNDNSQDGGQKQGIGLPLLTHEEIRRRLAQIEEEGQSLRRLLVLPLDTSLQVERAHGALVFESQTNARLRLIEGRMDRLFPPIPLAALESSNPRAYETAMNMNMGPPSRMEFGDYQMSLQRTDDKLDGLESRVNLLAPTLDRLESRMNLIAPLAAAGRGAAATGQVTAVELLDLAQEEEVSQEAQEEEVSQEAAERQVNNINRQRAEGDIRRARKAAKTEAEKRSKP